MLVKEFRFRQFHRYPSPKFKKLYPVHTQTQHTHERKIASLCRCYCSYNRGNDWPQEGHAERVDHQVTVSKYVQDRVACVCVFGLLWFLWSQVAKFREQISTFPVTITVGIYAVRWFISVWLSEYLVGHRDVVHLGSVTDDLFCLSNSVVSTQPHHRLGKQPAY